MSTAALTYAWDFGDGHTSTNDQPANTYTNGGSYSVTLTAVGAGGTNSLTRTNYILVTPPPLILTVGLANDQVTLTWLSVPDRTNWLEYQGDLGGTNWIALTNLLGTGNLQQSADGPTSFQPQRFYRVRVE